MHEDFIHYLWKHRLFNHEGLKTQAGENVKVISTGEHNCNAGPDFCNAKIKIGDTIWAGNIEIHINASDWNRHKHQTDGAYNNVILHIVHDADDITYMKNGASVPIIELKNRYDKCLLEKYGELQQSRLWIPCMTHIAIVNQFVRNNWLDRMLVERLERKSEKIMETLKQCNNSWEETFYQHLAANFGLKVNSQSFEMLARSLPLSCLAKHKNNLFQIEAMLFGQAGFLEGDCKDEYPAKLKKEYRFMQKKFNLQPIDRHLWKFLRLRPSNFPTIRISQFAGLVYKSSGLFSKILETKKVNELEKWFSAGCSEYWENHYVFDKPSVKKKKTIGKAAFENIMINTVVPFLFVYGMYKKEQSYKEKALRFLENIKGESNSIINRWAELGLPVETAYHTQALLELKNQYCNYKKCLSCSIGNEVLKN